MGNWLEEFLNSLVWEAPSPGLPDGVYFVSHSPKNKPVYYDSILIRRFKDYMWHGGFQSMPVKYDFFTLCAKIPEVVQGVKSIVFNPPETIKDNHVSRVLFAVLKKGAINPVYVSGCIDNGDPVPLPYLTRMQDFSELEILGWLTFDDVFGNLVMPPRRRKKILIEKLNGETETMEVLSVSEITE